MTFPSVLTNPAQANAPVVVNENFDALKASALFAKKASTTSGLTWGYFGGTMLVDGVLTTVADGTVALTLSATNYVEATRAGAVSANTTGFTAGRIPLYTLVCGASSVTTETDSRAWITPDYIAGRVSVAVTTADVTLSAAQARCNIINATGALTGNRNIIVPDGPATWCVTNNTTGAYTLTVKTLAGTGIAITQGKAADLLADGTNVVLSNNDAAAIGASLLAANNLSDLASAATARTNLGLAIGTNVQAYDADLDTIAGLAATTDNFMVAVSSAWASRTAIQAAATLQGDGLTSAQVGFRNIPSNSQSAAYTTVAADSGKSIDHPSTDANARTFTIDSNANVAYPVGTCITFTNMTSQVVTIAIATDTMYQAGVGTTGSRSLAQYGIATARKMTSTTWLISGTGLT